MFADGRVNNHLPYYVLIVKQFRVYKGLVIVQLLITSKAKRNSGAKNFTREGFTLNPNTQLEQEAIHHTYKNRFLHAILERLNNTKMLSFIVMDDVFFYQTDDVKATEGVDAQGKTVTSLLPTFCLLESM